MKQIIIWGGVGKGDQPSFLLLCVTTVCHAATVLLTECAKGKPMQKTKTIQILPSKNNTAGNRPNDRFSKAISCNLSLIWQKCSTVLARSDVLTGFCLQDALTSQQNSQWQQGPHTGMTFCCNKKVI